MASKELQVALRLLAKTNEFQAEIARASKSVADLGSNSQAASEEATSGFEAAKEAAGGLEGVLESATKAAFAFAAGFVGVQTAQQLIAIADSAANMRAKLTLATSSQEELAAATKATFDIAQATSTGLDATVTLYARLSSSLKEVGASQADIGGLTQTINQALAVSGATAAEASSAVLQLSQAFASGKLGGEEFGAVNESGSRIMTALAKALDVPRGKLKELAEQGRLTSQVIAAALKEQAASIASEAAKLPLTFERAVTQLSNSFIKFIGEIDQTSGASGKLAKIVADLANDFATGTGAAGALGVILKFLAENIELIAGAVKTGTIVFGGYLLLFSAAPAAFALAQRALYAFTLQVWAAAAAQVTLLGAGKAAFVGFVAFNVGTLLYEQFEVARKAGTYLVYGLVEGWNTLKSGTQLAFFAIADAIAKSLAFIQGKVADTLDGFVALSQFDLGFLDLRADFSFGAGDAIKQVAADLRDASEASTGFTEDIDAVGAAYDRTKAENDDFLVSQLAANESYVAGADAAAAQAAAQVALGNATGKTAKEILAGTAATVKGTAATKAATAAEKERRQAVIDAANRAFEADNAAAEGMKELMRLSEDLAAQVGGPSAQANLEHERTVKKITDAYNVAIGQGPASVEAIKARDEALKNAKITLDKTLTDNDPILQAAKSASENWARYWGDAINDVVDNFSHFLVNGLDSFKDFGKELLNIAKNIVADLISTFLKNKITVPIQAAISGGGGISGAFSALLGSGGTAATATTAASGGSGLLGGLSAIPVAGWIAAAIAVNAQLYASGWRPQGGTVEFGNGGTFTGGGAVRGGGIAGELVLPGLGIANVISMTTDRLLRGLGLSNQVASILSGSALVTRLFGRKAPEIQSQGVNLTVGQGTAIGTIFANILERGGLFRSDRRSVGTTGLTPELQADANAVSAQTRQIVRNALGGLATDLETTITGSFSSLTDKTGKVIEESITVLGVKYKEGLELLPVRVGAENIFASLAIITSQSLESFAVQFRAGAEGLLDAAVTAAAAQQLIAEGAGLLKTGDLLSTVNLVNELKVEGEKLTDALARVYGSAELLSQATRIMGISIAQTEADIVRFAVNISDSAGGLDQAAGLFDRFFQVAFTDAERGLAQLTAAETRRNALLDQAGLSGETTLATLRSAIEDLLKTGADPARLVLLLQAADAIADVADVVGVLADAATAAAAELNAAISTLDQFSTDLDARFTDLARSGLTDFERQMLSINDQLLVDVATLQRTRAEMVKRGATTEQLARIDRELARAHSFAAQAAAQAISLLRRQGQSLVAQLRKNLSDNVQQLADASSGAFQQITDAANDTYAAQLAGLKSIKEYLDSQLLGDLSSLTPEQRLAEAQAQFNAAVTGAQSGDPAALARLTQLADILLREGRAFSPSSFPELERSIRAALSGLVNAGPIGSPTVSTGGFGGDGVSGALDESANEFGASQAELALQIAEVMRQLGEATGDTLAEVAASIGVNVGELVTALGISLTELTAASTQQLAALAGSLGVELSELASNVGVELGALADRQSLLNDAVEAEIAALPESQRVQLQALFDAVQDAANDPAGLVIAQRNLSDAIKAIGGDTQNLLAPYFADIDPTNPLSTINTTLSLGFGRVVDAVNNVDTRAGQPTPPGGSFAVGTAFVPRDMLAQIHQGEAVIDASTMQALRRYGIPITGGVAANSDTGTNQDMLAELRAMRTELAQLRATVAAGDQDNVKATARAAKVQADAIESTRAARTGRLVGSY